MPAVAVMTAKIGAFVVQRLFPGRLLTVVGLTGKKAAS